MLNGQARKLGRRHTNTYTKQPQNSTHPQLTQLSAAPTPPAHADGRHGPLRSPFLPRNSPSVSNFHRRRPTDDVVSPFGSTRPTDCSHDDSRAPVNPVTADRTVRRTDAVDSTQGKKEAILPDPTWAIGTNLIQLGLLEPNRLWTLIGPSRSKLPLLTQLVRLRPKQLPTSIGT